MRILTGICLAELLICAGWDLKKREFPLLVPGIFFLAGLIFRGATGEGWLGTAELLLRLLPGVLLLILHLWKKETIGEGDGILVMSCGYIIGAISMVRLLVIGFIASGIIGACLLLFRKKKGTDAIPFAPFLLFAAIVLTVWESVGGAA
ncbi:MAG: prepilin peptidase [Lachnospiraceae bacterium]|nr:prepilin peptidase [Lachnospiraceae bacterium]